MSVAFVPGQRWMSETEPELGLGLVTEQQGRQVVIVFPATQETRRYMTASAPLRRVRFRVGDELNTQEGQSFIVTEITDEGGVLTYHGMECALKETHLGAQLSSDSPEERLRLGHWDTPEEYELRQDLWKFKERWLRSPARGLMGGRIDLLPHQLYIAREVIKQQHPRVLLADEPGLGKTIESCLILHHSLLVGRVKRVLVLVPESLQHQWFVELLCRFQLVFRIMDDEHCTSFDKNNEEENPFEDDAFILCSLSWLVRNKKRMEQAIFADWDMLVVDEVHHIVTNSVAYQLLFALSCKTPGVLLLTATPEQLGAESHFARLRILDPQRYNDYEEYRRQHDHFQALADLAAKLLDVQKPFALSLDEQNYWKKHDPLLLTTLNEAHNQNHLQRQNTVSSLLDRFGPGRVIFRNTRGAIAGFPEREAIFYPLGASSQTDSTANEAVSQERLAPRSAAHEDLRFPWLNSWLQDNPDIKVLLLCKTRQMVEELEQYLRGISQVPFAVFHEGLSLIQRDRNAAWFSEPNGARLLVCSEIGGEGRNFQMAQHLLLFDLPLDPELLEQRIGRLDRIGQAPKIYIHIPYIMGTFHEVLARWFHEGMDAFLKSKPGGNLVLEAFSHDLAALQTNEWTPEYLDNLIKSTARFQDALQKKQEQGRNRLLEWGSFNRETILELMDSIKNIEQDSSIWELTHSLFDALGVDVDKLTSDIWQLKPGPRLHPAFPWLKGESRNASFSRKTAMERDTTIFLTPDHPMVSESMDLLLSSQQGTASVVACSAPNPEIRLAVTFILEAIAPPALGVERFLPSTPITLTLNQRQEIVKNTETSQEWRSLPPEIFEHMPQLVEELIPALISSAKESVTSQITSIQNTSLETAFSFYKNELERIRYLRAVNPSVSQDEVDELETQAQQTIKAIQTSRVRMDSLQLQLRGI
ncbi:RNA polymerase-associated protein RapA [Myxococcota bacterium]|nr:RNA polymerase-associated protein RapA [Myxococcota bacterium]MBU1380356.1 RNA polymerase-associated protein RapA [Myxococcota bacterium]MBU1498204.1 RNA polymerase-associated protein RapA [Myxococcota bacterium]